MVEMLFEVARLLRATKCPPTKTSVNAEPALTVMASAVKGSLVLVNVPAVKVTPTVGTRRCSRDSAATWASKRGFRDLRRRDGRRGLTRENNESQTERDHRDFDIVLFLGGVNE